MTVVNVDAEGGASVTSGGATFIFVNSLGEAEFSRGRWSVIAFFPVFFRFRITPLGTSKARTSAGEASGEAEAASEDITT